MKKENIKKVVLAYSGGLDTSIIIPWLKENYNNCLSDESVTRSLYRQFFLDHGAVLKPDTEAATTDQMLTLVKSELGLAFVPEPMAKEALERGELVQLHLQEIIPTRSICLVYDRHRPLNTAARKFQQMLTKADPPRPAASKQTESISFVSQ